MNPKIVLKYIFLFSVFALLCPYIKGQRYIKDSVVVSFMDTAMIPPPYLSVSKIEDTRSHQGNIISITEKKQYQYVPVDFFVCLPATLENEIGKMFIPSDGPISYMIRITEFQAQKKNYFFKPGMHLNAAIQVFYLQHKDSIRFGGELLYEERYNKASLKPTEKYGYERIMEIWQQHFLSDMATFSSAIEKEGLVTLPNYRPAPYRGKIKNMYVGIDAIGGLDFWALDGEIVFSHREVERLFQRKAYDVRYRNEKDLEAIEFDIFNTHINYRLNDKYLFNAKGNVFIGLNKWKNLEENDYKLYDIAMLDISFSQRFLWNPLDKKSLILGAGLFESVNYIYHYSVRFQPGILIHLGVKL